MSTNMKQEKKIIRISPDSTTQQTCKISFRGTKKNWNFVMKDCQKKIEQSFVRRNRKEGNFILNHFAKRKGIRISLRIICETKSKHTEHFYRKTEFSII
jgi:hypothetical protein